MSMRDLQNQKPKFMKPFTNNVNSRKRIMDVHRFALQKYNIFHYKVNFFNIFCILLKKL